LATSKRVLGQILELTPISSYADSHYDHHKSSVESDLNQSVDSDKKQDEEVNHYIDQSFDNSKKEMNQVLYEHKNLRDSKSIDFSKNVHNIKKLR